MWLLLKGLALRFVIGRSVGGLFGVLLLLLVPLAGVLKFIGLPILLVLGLLGAPVMLLLAMVGLPVLIVLGIGGALVVMLGLMLSVGLILFKIALPFIIIYWLVKIFRRCRPSAPPVTTVPSMNPEMTD